MEVVGPDLPPECRYHSVSSCSELLARGGMINELNFETGCKMPYTDRATGRQIPRHQHIANSVIDIITTRRGTRVGRRYIGCDIPNMVDGPLNAQLLIDIYAEAADALYQQERRIIPTSLSISAAEYQAGRVVLDVFGVTVPENEQIQIQNIVLVQNEVVQ